MQREIIFFQKRKEDESLYLKFCSGHKEFKILIVFVHPRWSKLLEILNNKSCTLTKQLLPKVQGHFGKIYHKAK